MPATAGFGEPLPVTVTSFLRRGFVFCAGSRRPVRQRAEFSVQRETGPRRVIHRARIDGERARIRRVGDAQLSWPGPGAGIHRPVPQRRRGSYMHSRIARHIGRPPSYQMQAQVTVASSTASGTSVTLTATADAVTSPPMAAMPAATGSVTVGAAPASATPSPSPSRTPDPTATTSSVAAAAPPTLGPISATVTASSVISPGSLESVLPDVAPTSDPTLGGTPSSAADVQPDASTKTAKPIAGNFTLVMPAQTAEVLGLIILALIVSLATTRLVATGHLSLLGRPNGRVRGAGARATKRPALRRIRPPAGLHWRRRRPGPRAGPSPGGK